MNTRVFENEYNGSKVFGVWEVDENGEKTKTTPIVSMGAKKLKFLIKHIKELKELLENK